MKKATKLAIFLILFFLCSIPTIARDSVIEYYCPKCNSTNIEQKCLYEPRVERRSIDELAKSTGIVMEDLVCRWHNYEARCLDCGYVVKFTRPY